MHLLLYVTDADGTKFLYKSYYSISDMLKDAALLKNSGCDCWMRKIGEDNYFLRYYKYGIEVL